MQTFADGSGSMPDYVVRFGDMRFLGVFTANGDAEYRRDTKVVARTNRGLEIAEIVCPSDEEALKRLSDPPSGQILREMTDDDARELIRIAKHTKEELTVCQGHVERLELQMTLVDVEHIFGGERIVVYYLAENRVDFRELVKLLASEFQTRIEMRQ
ncbi:MAG: signal peptidase, partial [Candidatus Nealsonbacteria bacterium]|nr:signal peptidase [Candidatus Nealsonbacteria bacterium]